MSHAAMGQKPPVKVMQVFLDEPLWEDVARYLSRETQQYVEKIPRYEAEFALKSSANKHMKKQSVRRGQYRCTVGHWRTIDDRAVFICA